MSFFYIKTSFFSVEMYKNKIYQFLRYVIVGNHRDAWGFGAVDPSSGTAQMTEVIRGEFVLSRA
jgi:hypothetical protein